MPASAPISQRRRVMRRPTTPLFIIALLLVALCAATLTTALPAPAPAPHPASNRDLSQAPGAISGRSSSSQQGQPLERSEAAAAASRPAVVKRSLTEKAVLGARSFSSSSRMRTGGNARPRLMPFPALDEPIRRAGGLMEAFRTRGRN